MRRKKEFLLLDDTYPESITYKSQCMHCKLLRIVGKCKAFPDKIPMDNWTAKRKDCNRFVPLKTK